MRKRLKTLTGAAAALAALALGGAAIATAAQVPSASNHAAAKTHVVGERTTGRDTDRIQSGDQTTPDVRGKASAASGSETSTAEAPETSSESSAPSDGPGGHEDPAGVDIQNQEQTQE